MLLKIVSCLFVLNNMAASGTPTQPPVRRAPLLNADLENRSPDQYGVALKEGYTLEQHSLKIGKNVTQFPGFFELQALHGYVAQIDNDTLNNLVRLDPGVEQVKHDQLVDVSRSLAVDHGPGEDMPPLNSTAHEKRNYGLGRVHKAPYGLPLIAASTKLGTPVKPGDYDFINTAGSGVDVYVFDSGVTIRHDYFEGRAINLNNAEPNDPCPYLDNEIWQDGTGHGTHVAGIIAAKYFGVAPKARIISVKVIGQGTTAMRVAKAVEDVVKAHLKRKDESPDGQFRGSVINMSMYTPKEDLFLIALADARTAGINIFATAGNSNDDVGKNPVYPCVYAPVDCVAAIGPEYRRWEDSSYGNVVNFAGPGVGIWSLGRTSATATALKSGTSMATAFVSGAAAIWVSVSAST